MIATSVSMPLCGEAHNLSSPNNFHKDCVNICVAVLTEGRIGLLRKNKKHLASIDLKIGDGILQAACLKDDQFPY